MRVRASALAATCLAVLALTMASSRDARAEPQVMPIARLGLGPAFHIAPSADRGTQFAFDATVGADVFTTERVGVIFSAEAGYAYDGLGLHAFAFAPSIGFGHFLAYLAYRPRLLIGGADGASTVGMRNGIAMHVLADMGSLEIGHQFTSFGGDLHHSITLMFAVNPAAFIRVIAAL